MYQDQRLKKSKDFKNVFQNGSSWANQTLVLICYFSGLSSSRVGVSISKRVGNAVIRNKIKRRLREIIRKENLPVGWDMVFIARKKSSVSNQLKLSLSVKSLIKQAKLQDYQNYKEPDA